MRWDWFAWFAIFLAFVGFTVIKEKLERIAKLLEAANRQQAAAAEKISTKLDGVIHYAGLLNDKVDYRPGQSPLDK